MKECLLTYRVKGHKHEDSNEEYLWKRINLLLGVKEIKPELLARLLMRTTLLVIRVVKVERWEQAATMTTVQGLIPHALSLPITENLMSDIISDIWDYLDDLPDDADNYEVEKFDSDEDDGCEGGACKI